MVIEAPPRPPAADSADVLLGEALVARVLREERKIAPLPGRICRRNYQRRNCALGCKEEDPMTTKPTLTEARDILDDAANLANLIVLAAASLGPESYDAIAAGANAIVAKIHEAEEIIEGRDGTEGETP
jgi:hypothetical protein